VSAQRRRLRTAEHRTHFFVAEPVQLSLNERGTLTLRQPRDRLAQGGRDRRMLVNRRGRRRATPNVRGEGNLDSVAPAAAMIEEPIRGNAIQPGSVVRIRPQSGERLERA